LLLYGGVAEMTMGGRLKIDNPEIELRATLFTEGWQQSVSNGGMAFPDADGLCDFALRISSKEIVNGQTEVKAASDGALRVVYSFVPQTDLTLNGLFVGSSLDAEQWKRGQWRADNKVGVFPAERNGLTIFSGKVKELKLTPPSSEDQPLIFEFEQPTSVALLDTRQWQNNFSLRLGSNNLTKYAEKTPYRVAFTLRTANPLRLKYAQPFIIDAGPEWVALNYEKDIEAGSALDFSNMGYTDAPAGKHGWLKTVGGHFEFEHQPGVPQRFCGVNLCNTANFPTPEQSEQLAERLLRLGYNSVRIHHHDKYCVQESKESVTLNPEQMVKLDALLAACFKRGLYATTDLYVSRQIAWREIGIDRKGYVPSHTFKVLVAVHEPAYQNWAAYARNFLNHVNPHTGRRYADEPGMPLISLINEGAMGYVKAEVRQLPQVQAAWERWLKEQRARNPAAFADVPDKMPLARTGRNGAVAARFIADTETKMIQRMRGLLRDELQCRALLTNYNGGFQYTTLQPVREALHDYVDDHFYVNHPNFMYKRWSLPGLCNNDNPLHAGFSRLGSVAFTRLANKPFTITEYNFCWPGMYRGMAGFATGAMAALQNWSGLWRFDYAQGIDSMFTNNRAAGYFELADDPLAQAAERAVLCLFLRRDLSALENRVAIHIRHPPDTENALPDQSQYVDPVWKTAAWQSQVATFVGEAPLKNWQLIAASDAYGASATAPKLDSSLLNNNVVRLDQERGALTVATERTLGCSVEEGRWHIGAATITISGSPATIWISSLDAEPICSSSRLLLSHLTDMQDTGTTYGETERKTILARGVNPPLIRVGQAEIELTLQEAQAYKIYALATSGRRLERIATDLCNNKLCFTINVAHPEGARMLYEIVRDK